MRSRIASLAFVVLILAPVVAHAQIQKGDVSVQVQGDISNSGDNTSGSLFGGVNRYLTAQFALRTSAGMIFGSGGDPMAIYGAGLELSLAPGGAKAMPYVFADYTYFSMGQELGSYSDFTPGAGIRAFMSRQAAIFAQGTYQPAQVEGGDATIRATFGFQYFFSSKER